MMINNKHNIWLTLGLTLGLSFSLTSCNDWLNLLPNNEQVTEDYWKTKEDVESVVASGYYYMRQAVPTLITWGELRGGCFYNNTSGSDDNKLQDFDLLPTMGVCDYSKLYQVISMANSVLRYAPEVSESDNTYYHAMMQSHLCEAYFQRAWAYSILVKNYKEVPLIVDAYVNDDAPMMVAKSSESEIIAQIKSDVLAALDTKSAKSFYEVDWQTKGRATKWALYALMTDICLWNHDYDECIQYANMILEPTDARHPAFMTEMSQWYEIFYPGLSNESIFELYYDYNTEGKANNFTNKFGAPGSTSNYLISDQFTVDLLNETATVLTLNPTLDVTQRLGRTHLATFASLSFTKIPSGVSCAVPLGLWKYRGTDVADVGTSRVQNDANFILYRMADILLMKAEALVMKGESSWISAIELINSIRNRVGLNSFVDLNASDVDVAISSLTQSAILTEIMEQRKMEFAGEAKRWYDILRLARYDENFAPKGTVEDINGEDYANYNKSGFGQREAYYMNQAIQTIAQYNNTTSDSQLMSVLQNGWAWYLPIPKSEIDSNNKLKQNPYYE